MQILIFSLNYDFYVKMRASDLVADSLVAQGITIIRKLVTTKLAY